MTDTDRLLEAVNELVKPWNEIVPPDQAGDGYRVIDHDPRITMLRDLIASNSGGTTSGGSAAATRNLINVAAFDLWQKIDEQTKSAIQEAGKRPERDLLDALAQLATVADTLRATNDMTIDTHERLIARVERWKGEIDNLWDPPNGRKEIKAPCPDCGTSKVTSQEGETWAIVAYYWKGHDPAARCQACQRVWTGERELLELGFSIQANMDEDTLREMGVLA